MTSTAPFWLISILLLAVAAGFVLLPLWRRMQALSDTMGTRSLLLPLGLVVLMAVASYLFYARWGHIQELRFTDLYQRSIESQSDPQQASALIQEIFALVQQGRGEDDPWLWYFFGQNLAAVTQYDVAEMAYARAAQLLPSDDRKAEKAMVLGQLALMRYLGGEFVMSEEVMQAIRAARQLNPSESTALQLLATDAEDRQDWDAAIGYWRLLIQSSPQSELATVLRQRIAEAQQRLQAGDASSDGGAADSASGPVIEVQVSLAEGLQLESTGWVFVTARDAEQEGAPPLAVTRLPVADLPATVQLDDSHAVAGSSLSAASRVYVSALITATGTADAQTGDYRAVSDSFTLGRQDTVSLVIAEQLP